MKKKKIYIFNSTSRAAIYGIGTYISQLTDGLKRINMDFELIHIYSEGVEVVLTEDSGYKRISIPSVRYHNGKGAKYYFRNIVYLLKEIIPDSDNIEYIFHLNFMSDLVLITSLKKMYKCKIVLVAHYTLWSFTLLGDKEKMSNIMQKKYRNLKNEEKQIYKGIRDDERMIKKCDIFVCIAQHTFDSYRDACKIDQKKCRIINNGITDEYIEISSEEREKLRNKYFINKKTKIIFFAGRLDEVKGISSLISAFKKVLETNPDTHLLLAGDGDYTKWLGEAKNYWKKISFTGRLEKKQLFEFYKIVDLGIVCSLHEEFGLVAIEMMMHQLPIVVSDTGGLSEIVEHQISGLKVPVNTVDGKRFIDSQVLCDQIKLLLDDNFLSQEIALSGRQRFLNKYESSIFIDKMSDLYQSV